ncbi:protein tramtrack, beta isoform isoform X2 [Hyalella azteca]|uniref:Protein tramtrack, beta isoform isoform X2 n=1 Tax=Hyalella azteca TaxID=294128 RepID=A0A8B7PBQ6_HYAAZ|nr:protein tramtrack, beta isoform isoform X2 [Hyalella azteca]
MDGGLLSLKWNNHRSTFFYVLSNVRKKECYTDVTLACDGKFYPVHKLVLSTCSEYFEQMFEQTQCKHPVIVLKDIRSEELESLLSYMYVGEVNVVQEKLSGLIKAAECLRIKGLAVPDEEPATTKSSGGSREKRTSDNSLSSEAKRRRQDDGSSSQRQTSSREETSRRRADQSSSNKFNRNNASSSSSSVNSSRENRDSVSDHRTTSRDASEPNELHHAQQDNDIELKAEELPDAHEDLPSEVPPEDPGDAVKQEPLDLDAVYLSDSNSASDTKDMLVEDSFGEADGQQHFMDELLGQNSASDQHGMGDYGEGGEGSSSSSAATNQQQQHMGCEVDGEDEERGVVDEEDCQVPIRDEALASAPPTSMIQIKNSSASSFSKQTLHSPTRPITQKHRSFLLSEIFASQRATQFQRSKASASDQLSEYRLALYRDCDATNLSASKSGRSSVHVSSASSSRAPPAILESTVHVDQANSYKRYQCSLCGHSSLQKKDLVKHTRIHTGEKPFKCRYCEYRSTQSSNVNTHVKRVHPETLVADLSSLGSDLVPVTTSLNLF